MLPGTEWHQFKKKFPATEWPISSYGPTAPGSDPTLKEILPKFTIHHEASSQRGLTLTYEPSPNL